MAQALTKFCKEVDERVQLAGAEEISHLCTAVKALVDDSQPPLSIGTGVQHCNLENKVLTLKTKVSETKLSCDVTLHACPFHIL